jgi:hypothetical protein
MDGARHRGVRHRCGLFERAATDSGDERPDAHAPAVDFISIRRRGAKPSTDAE